MPALGKQKLGLDRLCFSCLLCVSVGGPIRSQGTEPHASGGPCNDWPQGGHLYWLSRPNWA